MLKKRMIIFSIILILITPVCADLSTNSGKTLAFIGSGTHPHEDVGLFVSSTRAINHSDQRVKDYFNQLANIPYQPTQGQVLDPLKNGYGDCDDKSYALNDFIQSLGYSDTEVMVVFHSSMDYSHAFVIWNGKAYDPTCKPSVYGWDVDRYFKMLRLNGFKV